MPDQLRPREFMMACKRLLDAAGDDAWDPDSGDAWTMAHRFAVCFSVNDGPFRVWEQPFGRHVTVVVERGKTYGEIVSAGIYGLYPKQAREMARALVQAAAWEEQLKEALCSFPYQWRHSAAVRSATQGMTSVQLQAWATEGKDA